MQHASCMRFFPTLALYHVASPLSFFTCRAMPFFIVLAVFSPFCEFAIALALLHLWVPGLCLGQLPRAESLVVFISLSCLHCVAQVHLTTLFVAHRDTSSCPVKGGGGRKKVHPGRRNFNPVRGGGASVIVEKRNPQS